jgi:hypothetical protein
MQERQSHNDIENFIMMNKTTQEYPCHEKVSYSPYVISDDLLRYKNFLAEQTKELKVMAKTKMD